MHCHIVSVPLFIRARNTLLISIQGWHTSEGFAMQFVEQYDKIAGITDKDALESQCDSWKAHSGSVGILQDDSGV